MDEPVLYPVSLDLRDRPCLVVGGGPTAVRKAAGLLAAGARVTVVAPRVDPALADLDVTVEERPYRPGEAAAYRLVLTTTGRPEVDALVHRDAETAGVFVNSADDPPRCSFQLPALWRDGAVAVAVSSGGSSPALGQWLRDRIATEVGPGAGALAELLDEGRRRLQAAGRPTGSVDWAALLEGPLPGLVRAGRLEEARALVARATASPP